MSSFKSTIPRRMNNTPGRQSGFSLIELMIASVIGLVLLSGVVTIFSSNSASSTMSTGMTRLQDSGRVALDILSYSLRMTGYQGCRDDTKDDIQVLATVRPTIDFPDNALWGSEVSAGNSWSPAVHADLTGISDEVKINTDVLYVQHGSGRSEVLASNMGNDVADVVIPANPDQLSTGDLIIITDCDTTNIFRATDVENNATNTTIKHSNTANLQNGLSKAFRGTGNENAVAVRVMRFESKAYFVGDSGRNMPNGDPVWSLFELDTSTSPIGNATEIIEGVEDFQVLYGVQPDPDVPSDIRYVAANGVTDPAQIVSVQLGLLLSTANYAASENDTQTYNIAGWTVGPGSTTNAQHPGDKRIRAAFNTTVQLRNRML